MDSSSTLLDIVEYLERRSDTMDAFSDPSLMESRVGRLEAAICNERAVKAIRLLRPAVEVMLKAEIEQLRKERDEALDNLQDASMAGAAVHAIREMLNEIGVPQAAFIDDHVRNGLVWARRKALEEAAQVADDEAEIERSLTRREAAQSADYIAQRIRDLIDAKEQGGET